MKNHRRIKKVIKAPTDSYGLYEVIMGPDDDSTPSYPAHLTTNEYNYLIIENSLVKTMTEKQYELFKQAMEAYNKYIKEDTYNDLVEQ